MPGMRRVHARRLKPMPGGTAAQPTPARKFQPASDRIAAVRTDNGIRVVTLEMVMVDHHKGVYRSRIEWMTELHSPAGGRRVQPGGELFSEQTEPEPLDQDRLRQLHDELLNR